MRKFYESPWHQLADHIDTRNRAIGFGLGLGFGLVIGALVMWWVMI